VQDHATTASFSPSGEGAPDAPDLEDAHPLLSRTEGFPSLPGVYLFKDPQGTILYVGKARDLKKRVKSYFRGDHRTVPKTRVLLKKAAGLEYVVTETEKEALLLEASLIKKHRPRYNVLLRDDKNYPALRIDVRDPYPRLEVVRRLQRDGALYFGPYPSAFSIRETLRLLNAIFPLRQCKSKNLVLRKRPCLNHALGKCLGVCAGKATREEYRKVVDELVMFLQGKTDDLQRALEENMSKASERLDFERAAFYRDRIRAIAAMQEEQHVVSDRFLNQDVLGIHEEDRKFHLAVLFIRQGVLVGQRHFVLTPQLESQKEAAPLLTTFIQQFYENREAIPDEILVPVSLEAGDALEEWLTEKRGKKVRVWPVQRGERTKLLELARRNAEERCRSLRKTEKDDLRLLEQLQKTLKLPRLPLRMACVDISNLQGRHAVGAVVVFTNGQPDPPRYRRYKVRGKDEPDDPAMMAEVVQRFLEEEGELAAELDLLVVDGGKGQLNRIRRLLEDRGPGESLPLAGIAKEREADLPKEERGLREKIYLPGRKNPVLLGSSPRLLHLVQRLRNEAHHTAVSFYQKRHRKEMLVSALDAIPGIGPKRRRLLLQHFGTMESLARASLDDLRALPAFPAHLADAVHDYFREAEGDGPTPQDDAH